MKKIFLFLMSFFILTFILLNYLYIKKPVQLSQVINYFNKVEYDFEPKNFLEKEAKRQIGKVVTYDFSQGYYKEGRPKDSTTGVCTDVVGDALKNLNYNLKNKVFNDIKKNSNLYSDKPDRNINFRRAKNLNIYFRRFEKSLTTSLSKENLKYWKGGDLVIWEDHIAVISSLKRKDALPYVISNHGIGVELADILDKWPSKLVGHFRIKKFED